MLDQLWFSIRFEYREIKIVGGSTIVMKGIKRNGVYVLDEEAVLGLSSVSICSRKDILQGCGIEG